MEISIKKVSSQESNTEEVYRSGGLTPIPILLKVVFALSLFKSQYCQCIKHLKYNIFPLSNFLKSRHKIVDLQCIVCKFFGDDYSSDNFSSDVVRYLDIVTYFSSRNFLSQVYLWFIIYGGPTLYVWPYTKCYIYYYLGHTINLSDASPTNISLSSVAANRMAQPKSFGSTRFLWQVGFILSFLIGGIVKQ